VVGYSVYLGVDAEGRKRRKFFARLNHAETMNGSRQTMVPDES
jgi:hypothetical protein